MKLEEVLDGHPQKSQILEYIEKIKNDSAIEGSRKANHEAQGLRTRLNKSKDILGRFGIDLEADDVDQKAEEVYARSKPRDITKDPDVLNLKKEIEIIKKERDEEKKRVADLQKIGYTKDVRDFVRKSLLEEGAIDNDLEDIFISRLQLDPAIPLEELKFNGDKGLREGIKEYFDSKPHLRKNQAHPGGGSSDQNAFTQAVGNKTTLTPAQKIELGLKKE